MVKTRQALFEDEHRCMLAALRRGDCVLRRQSRLSRSGRTEDQRARAAIDSATEHPVEILQSARDLHLRDAMPVLGGNESRIDDDAAGANREVVITVAEIETAHL